MEAFWIPAGAIIAFVAVLFAIPLFRRVGGGGAAPAAAGGGAPAGAAPAGGGGAAPAAAAAGGGAPVWYKAPWFIITLVASAGGVLWYVLATSENATNTAAFIALLAIAAYGAWKSGGGGSKYVTYLVVVCLIGFLGVSYYYGPTKAPEVIAEWQKKNYESAKSEKQAPAQTAPAATSQTGPSPDRAFYTRITTPVSSDWGPWIEGDNDRCIWVHRINPDVQMQVRLDRYGNALSWGEFRSLAKDGKARVVQAVRLRSDGTSTSETYEWRRPGECK